MEKKVDCDRREQRLHSLWHIDLVTQQSSQSRLQSRGFLERRGGGINGASKQKKTGSLTEWGK